ncbi:MAG: type II CAAX prenyl endopeptidase Rce1 family protein [Pseudomonadota bacterium]
MTPRALFAPVRRAEYVFWFLLLAALTLHLVPGSRRFYADNLVAAGADARQIAWESILWHHGVTFLVLLLPLLLLRPAGIHARGLSWFAPGDWRAGLKWTLAAAVVCTGPAWIQAGDPVWQREYPLSLAAFDSAAIFAVFLGSYLLYYIGWEAFFRGFVGFGMTGLGYTPFLALATQVALSTLVHIGKPDAELLGAIPFGILIGLLAWRTQSLLWPLLIHFYLGAINTWFCWLRLAA